MDVNSRGRRGARLNGATAPGGGRAAGGSVGRSAGWVALKMLICDVGSAKQGVQARHEPAFHLVSFMGRVGRARRTSLRLATHEPVDHVYRAPGRPTLEQPRAVAGAA